MNSWYPAAVKPKRNRRIGDVARELDVTVVTVRLWSDEFNIPVSRINGQRYFPQKALDRLRLIKFLLRKEGYTVDGAKKHVARLVSCNW
jgi:DNA-binding transcriptional MerR regulator